MESFRRPRPSLSAFSVLFVLLVNVQLSSAGECPADGRTWVPYGGSCYHFVHGEEDRLKSYSYQRAQSLCQGFELVTIQSQEENEFILKYSPEVWKGNTNVWLGMYYDTSSERMRWFGGQNSSYANWERGSDDPSDLVPVETCVALHTSTGMWEKISCVDEVENGVICETSQKELTPGRQIFAPPPEPSVALTVLVVLSVVVVMAISTVIWFLQQRRRPGAALFTPFEYHPTAGGPYHDRSGLVEAEETP
ncbi:CD302 antigen isoform X3 [Gadus macrocephalus]|uniref:CD302 antigen isoform X3 n=1 Tax=Gadus macrocephalus TaxID=80720 RepID=UPI0028CBA99B|nr:CD302 antigen isoform X3 [Gadus macrocephalus]